jgi:MoxR-like ATPase
MASTDSTLGSKAVANSQVHSNQGLANGTGHHPGKALLASAIRERVGRTVVGQDTVVERILIALLTGGHLLLQGVPGLAKTLLVQAVSRAIDLKFGRVQFTIDLLPADIVGAEVLDPQTHQFRIQRGPIFVNLLLADEINRATPKVQSALLEAMQERKVTIGSATLRLPTPFLVIATQNPIEQSGTFELPEAQLDRFMLCHRLSYPTRDEEAEVLRRSLSFGLLKDTADNKAAGTAAQGAVPMTAFDAVEHETPIAKVTELTEAMAAVQKVHVSEVFIRHCVDLADATRSRPDVELGCSPRAGIALVAASRARAYLHGREYVTPEDLYALAEDVLLHRMRLSYDALARGRNGRDVLREVLDDATR